MKRLILAVLGLVALSGGPARAQQGFSLTPVTLNMDTGRSMNASLTFTNTSAGVMTVNASVLEWTWQNGQEVNTPTRDLLLNPATFTLKPGESQVIRVGLRRKPADRELTYRLILEQQPPQEQPGEAGSAEERGDPSKPDSAPSLGIKLNQLFRARVAVYAAPASASARLGYALGRSGEDLSLSVSNSGNRHQTLYDLVVTRGDQTLPLVTNAVLQGATVVYTLPGFANLSGPLSVSYRNQDGETIHVQPPLP